VGPGNRVMRDKMEEKPLDPAAIMTCLDDALRGLHLLHQIEKPNRLTRDAMSHIGQATKWLRRELVGKGHPFYPPRPPL